MLAFATSSVPAIFVDNIYFKKYASLIHNHQLPLRRQVPLMMQNEVNKVLDEVKRLLNLAGVTPSITVDIASTQNKVSYLGVLGHFFNPETSRLETLALDIVEMTGSHTGEYISQLISKVLQDFDLTMNSVNYLVTDGAANIKLACRQLNEGRSETPDVDIGNDGEATAEEEVSDNEVQDEQDEEDYSGPPTYLHDIPPIAQEIQLKSDRHFVCVCHSLQNAIKEVFEEGGSMSHALRVRVFSLVAKFHRSPKATQQLLKKSGYSLVLPSHTRWSYIAMVYDRVLQVSEDFNSVCLGHNWKHLTQEELQSMRQMLEILKPFQHFTAVLQKRDSPTISLVYPGIKGLLAKLATLSVLPDLVKKLVTVTKRRFHFVLYSDFDALPTLFVSTALDPRTLPHVIGDKELLRRALKRMYDSNFPGEDQVLIEDVSETVPTSGHEDLFGFDLMLPRLQPGPQSTFLQEVDAYLTTMGSRTFKGETFDYWKTNKEVYPKLSRLALRTLSVPAASSGVESLFSMVIWHTTGRKCNSKPKLVKTKALLKFNEHLIKLS